MLKYILVSAVALACVGIATANYCSTDADCYYNGVCTNGNCSCEAGYSGNRCEYEQANCTLGQLRVAKGEYQICLTLTDTEVAWGSVCSNTALCSYINTTYPSCNFACGSDCSASCFHTSQECRSVTNTTMYACDILINTAPTSKTVSLLLMLFAIISMLILS